MSRWYTVRLSERYRFQVTLKSRNTVNVTHRCGKLIPGFRARDGERSGSHWRWRPWDVVLSTVGWPQMCSSWQQRECRTTASSRYAGAYLKATTCIKTQSLYVIRWRTGSQWSVCSAELIIMVPWPQGLDKSSSHMKDSLQRRKCGLWQTHKRRVTIVYTS